MKTAIMAANAEIAAYWAARDIDRPSSCPDSLASAEIIADVEARSAAIRAHRATYPRAEIDTIWAEHGFVPCGDAPGRRFVGAVA